MTHPNDMVEAVKQAIIDAAIYGGGSYRRGIGFLAGNPERMTRAAIAAMPANGMVGELVEGLKHVRWLLAKYHKYGSDSPELARIDALIAKAKAGEAE